MSAGRLNGRRSAGCWPGLLRAYSGVLVLRGEAGAGKTALLEETLAAAAAAGLRTARLTGVEAETQLGYAGLHRFLLPFAGPPGAAAGSAAGRAAQHVRAGGRAAGGPVPGGAGVLTLLADVASAVPLVCAVDDVQWLDPESAVVLGFVARRLYAERVVLVFAVREPAGELPALAGLPELAVGGLDEDAALELLASLAPGRLSPAVGARIFAGTGGNPLALVEVARELSPAQLAGAEALPEPLQAGGSLEQVFGRRLGRLPPEARLLLAVAAAEPAGSQALVWRAAGQLGIDPEAAAAADLGGLAEIGPQVEFRHPLVRSVVYYATPLRQRRLIHQALAAAGDGEEPDRVAWHLGMAAAGPDEAVAARLEQAAGRARDRGGYAATVTFLSRAAELSADQGARAGRLLAAAEAALIAGQPVQAAALLEEATPLLGGPLARAQARRLDGTLRLALGQAGEAAPVLLEAARALAPADLRGARAGTAGGVRGGAVRRLVREPGGLVGDRAPRRGRCRPQADRRHRRPTCCWTASPCGRAPVTRRACRCSAAPSPCSVPTTSARRRACAGSGSAALRRRTYSMTRPSTRWPSVWCSSPVTRER